MGGLQNLHSHSVYCDGSLTLEEMVLAAIAKGCDSFGFSGHSYAPFDNYGCMTVEGTANYFRECAELKEKYAEKIDIFTGIEQEHLVDPLPGNVDFIIGGIHYLFEDGNYVCVDAGAEGQQQAVDTFYGGDYYTFAETYFSVLPAALVQVNANIVAHFDIVTKYNFNGCCFDEAHPRYVAAALDAMDKVLKNHRLFEVNTGAMYRLGRPEPYPSVFLLKELRKRGGEVILTSDSHDAGSICYKFDEMRELLKTCGFRYMKRLTKDGFTDVLI